MRDLAYTKSEWRTRLLAARRALPVEVRRLEASALAEAAGGLVLAGQTVCCYVPVGTEPGSPAMLDTLSARDVTILLPVVTGRSALDWARYAGPDSLVAGPHRLVEPNGPRLGPEAIGDADLVLVPALAVDRIGVRLGRGAGHYDRSLPLARSGVRLVAVVRDEELVERLPAEPHDVLMSGALTPRGGLVPLPA